MFAWIVLPLIAHAAERLPTPPTPPPPPKAVVVPIEGSSNCSIGMGERDSLRIADLVMISKIDDEAKQIIAKRFSEPSSEPEYLLATGVRALRKRNGRTSECGSVEVSPSQFLGPCSEMEKLAQKLNNKIFSQRLRQLDLGNDCLRIEQKFWRRRSPREPFTQSV